MSRLPFSGSPLLVLSVIALGLSACATNPPVDGAEAISTGPTVYGKVSVSLDHVSTR
jgi:hypothetical protein